MTIISVKTFGGVSPRTPPRYLQDVQAQVARNCPVWLGSLRGLPNTAKVKDIVKTAVQAIYRFGQDINSDQQYWFEFTGDVDIVRGAVAGDVEERTYFTDGVKPKKTNNTLALTGGSAYPIGYYDLGIPRPATAAAVAVAGAGSNIPETRVYTYTFVSSWGEESQPADPSALVNISFGQTANLSMMAPVPAGNHNIATRRIYRAVAGSNTVEYLFVDEIPAAQTTYADTKLSEDLGEVLPSTDWAAPPNGLKGLVAMPNGILAGFVGRDVYFCDPYHPYAWPAKYVLTVPYPIVGLGVMDTTLAVLTTGKPSFYQGVHPENMAEVHTDITQACVSKRSIVSMDGAVLYASPDGIVKLSPGGSGILTEQLFTRELWQLINPSSIKAYTWESKYVGFFDNALVPSMAQGGFVIDPSSGAFVYHDIYASAGYNDLQRDTLYLVIGNEIHAWYAGLPMSYTWRSKKFTLPQPMGFSCAQVEAESYPLTFKFYAEGTLLHTQTVTSRDGFRLPPGRIRDLEFEVSGSVEIFAVVIAQAMQELASA